MTALHRPTLYSGTSAAVSVVLSIQVMFAACRIRLSLAPSVYSNYSTFMLKEKVQALLVPILLGTALYLESQSSRRAHYQVTKLDPNKAILAVFRYSGYGKR